jgi:hypothetical protein
VAVALEDDSGAVAQRQSPMQKRTAPRHRFLKAGEIEFGGGAIDCMVRNWSSNGAALDVASLTGIPDHFNLFLLADGI